VDVALGGVDVGLVFFGRGILEEEEREGYVFE
jgi:hypothetical protein